MPQKTQAEVPAAVLQLFNRLFTAFTGASHDNIAQLGDEYGAIATAFLGSLHNRSDGGLHHFFSQCKLNSKPFENSVHFVGDPAKNLYLDPFGRRTKDIRAS